MKTIPQKLGASLLLTVLLASTTDAFGANDDPWLSYLSQLNRISPIEPASARGELGLSVGIGATHQSIPDNSDGPLIEETIALETPHALPAQPGEGQYLPKLWIDNGTKGPFSYGFFGGVAPKGRMNQFGAHCQWTVYEKPQRPAVAFRSGLSRLQGLATSRIDTFSASVQSSYSFGFLVAFMGAGATYNNGVYDQPQLSGLQLTQTDPGTAPADPRSSDGSTNAETKSIDESWAEEQFNLGFRIIVFPPFVRTGIEWTHAGEASTFAAKVAVGL